MEGPRAEHGERVAALARATQRYGPVTAVDRVDLAVHRGEVPAVLGSNGAGKTTTVSMLVGLIAPDGDEPNRGSGRVWSQMRILRV